MDEHERLAASVGAVSRRIQEHDEDVDDVYEDDPYGGDDDSKWDDDSDDWEPTEDRSVELPGDDDTPGYG